MVILSHYCIVYSAFSADYTRALSDFFVIYHNMLFHQYGALIFLICTKNRLDFIRLIYPKKRH